MSTEEIKEALDEWLEDALDGAESEEEESWNSKGYFNAVGKWKRLSKKRDAQGRENRIFLNTSLNKKMLVVGDKIKGWYSDGGYAFYIGKHINEPQALTITITDLKEFKAYGHSSDWHLTGLVVLPDYLDEEMEATFISYKSKEEINADLIALGFVQDSAYSEFMKKHYPE